MKWSQLSNSASKRKFEELCSTTVFAAAELTSEYLQLRNKLLEVIPAFSGSEDQKAIYDVEVGLSLYRILMEAGFDVRSASNDGIWRHLSLSVIPDRVESRWLHRPEARFWRSRSRIWLRALWWLVHLAWQGSESATRKALTGVTTDMIVQIIERPGRHGFRVDLARSLFNIRKVNDATQTQFRALMKLNTARVVVVEPAFFDGGIAGYAKSLYAAISSVDNIQNHIEN